MRRPAYYLLGLGLALEFLLVLFPPMRITLAAESGNFLIGRTRHFFLFSHLGGVWVIDTGRFVVYTFLIVVTVLIAIAVEAWIRSPAGARARSIISNIFELG